MKFKDLFYESYSALSANKVRSGLTMLGIVIGICSVIVLVGVGQGATSSITSSISSLGSNLLVVSSGSTNSGGVRGAFGSATTLKEKDAEAIENQAVNIASIATVLSGNYQITAGGNNTNSQTIGTEASYADIRNVTMETGNFISDQQVSSRLKVVVLGSSVRDDLFGEGTDPVGQTLKINKIKFQVIGVAEYKGGSGFTNSDNAVYVPITVAQTFLAGKTSISNIYIQAKDADSVYAAQQEVTEIMMAEHGITDTSSADFTVTNQADIVSSLSSVTQTLTLLLGAIAGISLLVGGIGIMNMMLTTVTERTREIGLRKAVGARKKDIQTQFLVESIMLTFIGGVIGIVLGWLIATILTKTAVVSVVITWQSVILAFGVSAAIGILFGYYPARRASSLNPIEALKYE